MAYYINTVDAHIVALDARTRKVTHRPEMIPKLGVELEFCPSFGGVRNWRATAYDPETQALYIPIHPSCTKGVFTEVKKKNIGNFHFYGDPTYTGWKSTGVSAHPASPDHRGHLIAMDIKSGKVLWQHSMSLALTSAALTTGGGLAIVADADGYLYIGDIATGKSLFQTRLPIPARGFPITYAVRGRQYLAIPVGSGGGTPATAGVADSATGGNAMHVFALP